MAAGPCICWKKAGGSRIGCISWRGRFRRNLLSCFTSQSASQESYSNSVFLSRTNREYRKDRGRPGRMRAGGPRSRDPFTALPGYAEVGYPFRGDYGPCGRDSSKRNLNGNNAMRRWLGLGLLLGAGLGSVAWAQDSARFDGQYMGELTLTKVIDGDCTQPPLGSLYPLTISKGRVGMWRGGGRPGMSVSAPFVWRCLSGSTIAPFPHPSHRTGHADFPASGSRTRHHAFAHGTSRPSRVRRTSPKVS